MIHPHRLPPLRLDDPRLDDPPPPPPLNPPPLRDHTHPHPHHTRTGDFQLINFIALQRATAFFVYGLLPACKGFVGYAWCVNDMALGNPLACDEEGPGVSQSDMMKFVQRQVESWAGAELSLVAARSIAQPAQLQLSPSLGTG